MTSRFCRTWRIACAFSLVATTAMLGPAGSQTPPSGPTTQKSTRIVWQGVVEVFGQAKGHGSVGARGGCNQAQYDFKVRFRFVEEPHDGYRFTSKRYDWSGDGTADDSNGPASCQASGSFEFSGKEANEGHEVYMEKAAMACEAHKISPGWMVAGDTCGIKTPPVPDVVPVEKLRDNCSYSEATDRNAYDDIGEFQFAEHYRYSVWVSPQVDAVMEVKTNKSGPDSRYYNFVPEPGATITFLVKSSFPGFFRFTLEEVSNLPGYAMNAAVDDEFFTRFGFQQLKGKYGNESPDLIFDPSNYQSSDWKTPDFTSVETAKESQAASVTVTAMDYGAHGSLHAYFKSKCGGWQPVKIEIDGKPAAKPALTLPKDDDGTLIADKMKVANNGITTWAYNGDPGKDDDQYPKGDGTAGDGFTVFEEYRGFMVTSDYTSNPDACAKNAQHVRTDPDQKDFFVYIDDPELADAAQGFGETSRLESEPKGIALHFVCKKNMSNLTSEPYQPPANRVVNFTLQPNGPKEFLGKTLSGGLQTGIVITSGRLEGGKVGDTRGTEGSLDPRNGLGPPVYVNGGIIVDKSKLLLSHLNPDESQSGPNFPGAAPIPYYVALEHTVLHELGHAVGIDHHGDDDVSPSLSKEFEDGINVIMDSPCAVDPGFSLPLEDVVFAKCSGKVTVVESDLTRGKHVCVLTNIARMHGLHSGNAQDPMKYDRFHYHESPTHPLRYAGHIPVKCSANSQIGSDEAYTGDVYPYRNDLDPPGLGHFAADAKGTGVNGLPGEENHAGDACRPSSAGQIRVKDWGSDRPAWIKCPQPGNIPE
jgi:hypothetical protein